MKPFYKQVIKFFAFLLVTIFLFWLVYRDQNFDDLMKVLCDDVDYTWIWVAIVFGLLSHVSRSLRWQMLTKSMGYRISFMNSFMGVMIGYFANMAIPRMGEFTRCGVVSKYENVPFSKLLGTVVTERVFDMIMLLLLTLIVVVSQFKQVGIFLDSNEEIKQKLYTMVHSSWTYVALGVLIVGIMGFFWFVRKSVFFTRLHRFLSGMKEGLLTVKNVERKWLFIGHTVFIWLMYFLMLYVCFFCFFVYCFFHIFYFFSAIRNLALLERGFLSISASLGTITLLLINRKGVCTFPKKSTSAFPSTLPVFMMFFTMRSSNE